MGAWRRRRRSGRESSCERNLGGVSRRLARANMERALRDALRDAKTTFGSTSSGASASPWRSAVDVWVGFFHAIDWTETWLRALLASHAVLLSIVLIYRKSERVQGVLFCACTTVVLAAERLNALGNARWESFASQNYFDKRGRFISVVLSTPLLVVTIVILINFLAIMTGMMVEVAKRRRCAGVKKTQ